MLRRNGPVVKSVESVLRLEGSLWWERFVKEVGLEPGVKERGSYGWWEWWADRVRRSGRSMNRKDRDRGTGMRLTERTRKLIPETWWGVHTGRNGQLYVTMMTLVLCRLQKFVEKVNELFECICCQELLYQPVTTECAHNFCKVCHWRLLFVYSRLKMLRARYVCLILCVVRFCGQIVMKFVWIGS